MDAQTLWPVKASATSQVRGRMGTWEVLEWTSHLCVTEAYTLNLGTCPWVTIPLFQLSSVCHQTSTAHTPAPDLSTLGFHLFLCSLDALCTPRLHLWVPEQITWYPTTITPSSAPGASHPPLTTVVPARDLFIDSQHDQRFVSGANYNGKSCLKMHMGWLYHGP